MLHEIRLNGANYVNEERQRAFRAVLEPSHPMASPLDSELPTVDEVTEQTPAATKGDGFSLPTPPVAWSVPVDHTRVLESLERGLERSYDHQSETMRVHQHYLTNEASYANLFAQLLHDQGTLVAHSGSEPVQQELALAILQSLGQSIARFHDHQAQTLSVHSEFLEQQAAYAESFVELLQHQYGAVLHNRAIPDARVVPAGVPGSNGNGNGNGNGHSNPAYAEVSQVKEPVPPLPTTMEPATATTTPSEPRVSPASEGPPAPDQSIDIARLTDAPAPMPSQDSSRGVGVESIATLLLSIVSDKTGYPVEMLDLEMDLEADLGIDSIKRVEILGALEDAHPELGEIEPEALSELRTLASILRYVTGFDSEALPPAEPASPKKA